jgi:capsular exopolysaccharide synthesis family protein
MHAEAVKLQRIIDSTEARISRLEADLATSSNPDPGHLISTPIPQALIAGTEARIKQLESDLQALSDLQRQREISQQVLKQQIATSEARIKQLESDLRNTVGLSAQRLVLDEIAQERNHLTDIQRTEMDRQHLIFDQIMKDIIKNAGGRIEKLEAELAAASDAETESLVKSQIDLERDRLSDLQHTDIQRQRLLLDQALEQNRDVALARISKLEADLLITFDLAAQRLILVQMAQEGQSLSRVQQTEMERLDEILNQTLEIGITSITSLVDQLRSTYQAAADTERQRVILDEIAQERNRLSEAHKTLTLLYTSLQQSSVNQIKIVESATIGTAIAARLWLKLAMAGVAGFVLALAIALTFEYFDDTIKTAQELAQVTGVPVLGIIATHTAHHSPSSQRLIAQALPGSRAAQDYRLLGTTRLLLPHSNHRRRSILISSMQVGDDSTEIAANLAVTLAQAGNRVILVDANMNNPAIGQLFDCIDRSGLADVLTRQIDQPELVPISWAPGLSVLPTGPVTRNQAELLASPVMARLIGELEEQADIVIVSASPQASFVDSLILAAHVGGVMLVVYSGKTRRVVVAGAVEYLHSLNAHIIGTALINNGDRVHFVPWRASVPVPREGMQSA